MILVLDLIAAFNTLVWKLYQQHNR